MGTEEATRRVFTLTERVMASLHDDLTVDAQGYTDAITSLDETGDTNLAVFFWAQALSWAYPNGDAVDFPTNGDAHGVRHHIRRFVDTIKNDTRAALHEIYDTKGAMTPAAAWGLVAETAWAARAVYRATGGITHLNDVAVIVDDCTDGAAEAALAGPAAAGLAAVSMGDLDSARRYLAVAVGSDRHAYPRLLAIWLRIGHDLFTRPSALLVSVDDAGMPVGTIDTQAAVAADTGARLGSLGRDLIVALQGGDNDQAEQLLDQAHALPEEDKAILTWQLAISVGTRIGQIATSPHPDTSTG